MLLRTEPKEMTTTDSKLTIVSPPAATFLELNNMLPLPTEDYSTKKMSAGRSFSLEEDTELHIRSGSR